MQRSLFRRSSAGLSLQLSRRVEKFRKEQKSRLREAVQPPLPIGTVSSTVNVQSRTEIQPPVSWSCWMNPNELAQAMLTRMGTIAVKINFPNEGWRPLSLSMTPCARANVDVTMLIRVSGHPGCIAALLGVEDTWIKLNSCCNAAIQAWLLQSLYLSGATVDELFVWN
jgi:hypothetical protein